MDFTAVIVALFDSAGVSVRWQTPLFAENRRYCKCTNIKLASLHSCEIICLVLKQSRRMRAKAPVCSTVASPLTACAPHYASYATGAWYSTRDIHQPCNTLTLLHRGLADPGSQAGSEEKCEGARRYLVENSCPSLSLPLTPA